MQVEFFNKVKAERAKVSAEWDALFDAWKNANPEQADELQACATKRYSESAEKLLELIPPFPTDDKSATRVSGGIVMNTLAAKLPYMVTGAADLFGSTKNYLKGFGDFSADIRDGRNIWFGVR